MFSLMETSPQHRKLTNILNIPEGKSRGSGVIRLVFTKTISPLEQKRFIM